MTQSCACPKCSNTVDPEDYAAPLCPLCYGEGCAYTVRRDGEGDKPKKEDL